MDQPDEPARPPGSPQDWTEPALASPEGPKPRRTWRSRVRLGCMAAAVGIGLLYLLVSFLGWFQAFSVPSDVMAPAMLKGDRFMMDGLTYHFRNPRRGDIVVFRSDGIRGLQEKQVHVRRVAGEPGERVRLSDGRLYVNDARVAMRSLEGEILYTWLRGSEVMTLDTPEVTVPEGHYYVLSDNSARSSDSRYWGCIPEGNITGRARWRFSPLSRMGQIH